MIQPPFPSTIGAQSHPVAFLTTKAAVRKNQENDGQGRHAWTSPCLRKGGGGALVQLGGLLVQDQGLAGTHQMLQVRPRLMPTPMLSP